MWKIKSILSVAAAVLVAFGSTRTASAELVGHWAFDETSGGIAMDMSGYGHDGVVVDDITWDKGHLDGAVRFTGGGRIDIPAETWDVIETQVTITLWIYGAEDLEGNYAFIASGGNTGTNGRKASTHLPHPNGNVYWDAGGGGPGAYDRIFKEVPEEYGKGQWVHWAFVKNADSGQMKIYLNGTLFHQEGGKTNTFTNITTFSIGGWTDGTYQYRGRVDDFQIHNVELTEAEIQQAMKGISRERASAPTPEDAMIDVLRNVTLEWQPGEFSATHNLYWGDSFEDVNDATVPTASGLDVNSFDPGRLAFGKTYFWRVDEVNGTPEKTVFKGHVWTFTAEPYSIQIPGSDIIPTASSFIPANPPSMTVNGSGLDGNIHLADSDTMWLSVSGDLSPWLMVEFDQIQKLDKMLIWNSNSTSEGFIGWGIKDVNIEGSMDGVDWTAIVPSSQIARAPGLPTYDTPQAIDLGLAVAKYVRINILSNWGGLLKQYGVSEVQFYGLPVYARTPDPASGSVDVLPDSMATWRVGREAAQHRITMDTDASVLADGSAFSVSTSTNSLDMSSLDPQLGTTYYWRVDEVNEAENPSGWEGPVWSLSTAASLVVDDFESYSNLSPDRPFQAWHDGFGYSADEFFPVAYPGNGTGAGIGHDIWSPSSPYFNGDIMETTDTLPGSDQSMPFYYTNTGGVASETQRTFTVAQDWTVGGVKTLSIAFFGQAGNTGTLYVKINNTKLTYPRAATNIAVGAWQAWNIDLSSMDVQNVTTLQIGVDGSAASGMILIDDIKLHAEAGETITPADPGNNGLVAHYSFEGNANDMSGNSNNGTVNGGVMFAPGHDGQAIDCDGIDGYISTGKVASDLGIGGNNARTISSWVYTRGYAGGGIYDMGARVATQDFCLRTLDSIDNRWRIQYWGGDTDFSFDTKERWVHFTHVHDGVNTKIYANGLLIVDWEKTIDTTDVNPFQIGLYGWPGNYFDGLIDEVRVYDRALSAEEALFLADITSPIDKPF